LHVLLLFIGDLDPKFEGVLLMVELMQVPDGTTVGMEVGSKSVIAGTCTSQEDVKTHCYMCSDGLIQAQGSAGVPKAVYD
jgi:hypothetical protein